MYIHVLLNIMPIHDITLSSHSSSIVSPMPVIMMVVETLASQGVVAILGPTVQWPIAVRNTAMAIAINSVTMPSVSMMDQTVMLTLQVNVQKSELAIHITYI